MENDAKSDLVTFEGIFKVWIYDVSHACLLLRRQPVGHLKRLDVLFKSVRALQSATLFDSLTIQRKARETFTDGVFGSEWANEPGLKLFELTTKNWNGYIVAGNYFWREDERDFGETSSIYEPGPLICSMARKSSWFRES